VFVREPINEVTEREIEGVSERDRMTSLTSSVCLVAMKEFNHVLVLEGTLLCNAGRRKFKAMQSNACTFKWAQWR